MIEVEKVYYWNEIKDKIKVEKWYDEEFMEKLENELPEIDGHVIEWNTTMKYAFMLTMPFKIRIKPEREIAQFRFGSQ